MSFEISFSMCPELNFIRKNLQYDLQGILEIIAGNSVTVKIARVCSYTVSQLSAFSFCPWPCKTAMHCYDSLTDASMIRSGFKMK